MKAEPLELRRDDTLGHHGVLEAIYWKPQIAWRIDRIHVLSPIRFSSVRRERSGQPDPRTVAREAMKSGRGRLALYADDDRQQRATTHLRDVDYVVEAHFVLVERSESLPSALMFPSANGSRPDVSPPLLGVPGVPCLFLLGRIGRGPFATPDELRGEPTSATCFTTSIIPEDDSPLFPARLLDGVLDVPPWNPEEAIR